jgi:hypothetical protein
MIKRFNNYKTLTKFVIISLIIVIIYSVCEFVFSTITGVSHEVLTTCIFALFGTEIAACGLIKIFKLKEES